MPRTSWPSIASILLLAPLASGCLGGDDGGDDMRGPPVPTEVTAPWWPVGAHWDVELAFGARPVQHVRVANFLNDSATAHFWLGVADRPVAMDHALHDTNPLLGRVHWEILTPHEKGIHAHGMYSFPTSPGESMAGIMFGREWDVTASAGPTPGSLVFEGSAADGATIRYDYDPAVLWFSSIEVHDPEGGQELQATVTGHATGAQGTFYFLRGRDYYAGPKAGGTHEEPFDVLREEPALHSLAIELKGTVTGPLRLDFLDPAGTTRHSETLAVGSIDRILEIPSPPPGTWRLRYVGTGDFQGLIEATGIVEYRATL